MYMPINCTRVILKLPVASVMQITYQSLLEIVIKKYRLLIDSEIRMKYKVNEVVLEIIDDLDDLENFEVMSLIMLP